MAQTDDRTFLKRFSGIIVGLMIVTGIIIVLALSMRSAPDPDANPSKQRLAAERIAPVSDVRVGAEGQAELAAQAEAQTQVEPAPAPVAETGAEAGADEETLAQADAEPAADAGASATGKEVYDSVCLACHAAGVAGAPIPGSEEYKTRLAEKGEDGLVASVINGLNVMPPRGGRMDLSDEDIRAAVQFMDQ